MNKISGVLWQRRSDETLIQTIIAACARHETKMGQPPTVVLVHSSVELPDVAGVEVRPSPYVSDKHLIFVGRERETDV